MKSKLVRLLPAAFAVAAVFAWVQFRPAVQAQDNLTPGMLFGPISLGLGESANLCFSLLSEGDLTALIHFRNISTGEVSPTTSVSIKSGGGGCASYVGQGLVVGMSRGDGKTSDWVSTTNALIGTMTVINNGRTGAAVQGIPKIWLKGL